MGHEVAYLSAGQKTKKNPKKNQKKKTNLQLTSTYYFFNMLIPMSPNVLGQGTQIAYSTHLGILRQNPGSAWKDYIPGSPRDKGNKGAYIFNS